MSNLLPRSIADPHYLAVDAIAAERALEYDVAKLVPLLLDEVEESALTHLAEWFSILGIEGWEFALTVEEKRALLKQAIELHRHKATPWSIKNALLRLGFDNVVIEEGRNSFSQVVTQIESGRYLVMDGEAGLDGVYDLGSGTNGTAMIFTEAPAIAWAFFRVILLFDETNHIAPRQFELLLQMIDEFKNVRSWLTDVCVALGWTDTAPLSHLQPSLAMTLANINEFFDGAIIMDGTFEANGTITCGRDGITDEPNAEFFATAFVDGVYDMSGSLFATGQETAGEDNHPLAAGLTMTDELELSDTFEIGMA